MPVGYIEQRNQIFNIPHGKKGVTISKDFYLLNYGLYTPSYVISQILKVRHFISFSYFYSETFQKTFYCPAFCFGNQIFGIPISEKIC